MTFGINNAVMLHISLLTTGIVTGDTGWFIGSVALGSISILLDGFK